MQDVQIGRAGEGSPPEGATSDESAHGDRDAHARGSHRRNRCVHVGIFLEGLLDNHLSPDGRMLSFIRGVSLNASFGPGQIYVKLLRGDRQMTSEGYAFLPSVSPDSKKLYYLVRAGGSRNLTGGLWVSDLTSGQRQQLLPDFQMRHYTISADGERVVLSRPTTRGVRLCGWRL